MYSSWNNIAEFFSRIICQEFVSLTSIFYVRVYIISIYIFYKNEITIIFDNLLLWEGRVTFERRKEGGIVVEKGAFKRDGITLKVRGQIFLRTLRKPLPDFYGSHNKFLPSLPALVRFYFSPFFFFSSSAHRISFFSRKLSGLPTYFASLIPSPLLHHPAPNSDKYPLSRRCKCTRRDRKKNGPSRRGARRGVKISQNYSWIANCHPFQCLDYLPWKMNDCRRLTSIALFRKDKQPTIWRRKPLLVILKRLREKWKRYKLAFSVPPKL